MIRIKTGFAFIFNLLLLRANAQVELDPVTVTASVNPLQASQTGRNILVIKGEQFSKLPVHSIDELLRYLPGIEVQNRGAMGSQADIVMRGGTFQQVLVILDGIRLNDPNTGHFSAYIPIAPAEIERIEVLKGASSAIYGSEAVGGVIHIITKSFSANPHAEPKKAFQMQAAGGQYDLWSLQTGGFYQHGSTAVNGGLLTNNSHGQPQRGTRGSFNNHTASLSVKHFLNDQWSISARSSFDQRTFSAQNFYTTFVSDTAQEKVKTLWNQLQLVRQSSKDRLTIDLGYKNLDDRYQYNPSSVANQNKSNLWQALIKDEFKLNDKTSFTAGTQFIHKHITSNDRGDHRLNQAAVFVILNQQVSSRFFISPALRTDYHESSGWELVPQVNLSYRYTNWQLRASAGKTLREADFTERYNNYNKTLVTGGSIGNPDLTSERSFSYEAGADYYAGDGFRISATFFQRLQKRLIDWTPTPYTNMPRKDNLSPAGTFALALNIARVNTLGAELDIQYHGHLAKGHQLISSLGLVWLDSRGSDSEPSFYISSHARFLANGNLQYLNQRLAISVTGVYKNRKPQKAPGINAQLDQHCVMINSRLDIYLLANKLAVFAQLDNVLDNTCQDLLGSQLPGRWLMGGLKLNLQ